MSHESYGERFVPSLRGQSYYGHVHRYALAARFCAGKRVLDASCGLGYGAAFLARTAASVLGVDTEETSIVEARRIYYQVNLQFAKAAIDKLPLIDGSIDVITCFETIERVVDQEALLDEFRRVLAPGGVLLIATPNRLVYSDKQGNRDPGHVRELYFEEFRDLLTRQFTNVRICGQRLLTASVVHPLGAPPRDAAWLSGDAKGVANGLGELKDPAYFVAACSYAALPDDIVSAFVDPDDDLLLPIDQSEAVPVRGSLGRAAPTRVLVACAPKSGSTFVSNVLARYFDARVASSELREMQWEAEQSLTRSLLAQLGAGSYVMQLHMKPYDLYFRLMREYGVSLLLQWRNIGDAIVSLDEHLAEFGVDQPLCYIHDGDGFLGLPADRRYDFLIRNTVGWYVWFYLAWRKRGASFGVYERMVADPTGYFEDAIAKLGFTADTERLSGILAAPEGFTRLNVGRVGRSAELFSDENKRLLESTIAENPWIVQLDILLWELPWDVPQVRSGNALDGCVIQPSGREAEKYFVSRGVRHRLGDAASWLASRATIDASAVRSITARRLKAIPEGDPIT